MPRNKQRSVVKLRFRRLFEFARSSLDEELPSRVDRDGGLLTDGFFEPSVDISLTKTLGGWFYISVGVSLTVNDSLILFLMSYIE